MSSKNLIIIVFLQNIFIPCDDVEDTMHHYWLLTARGNRFLNMPVKLHLHHSYFRIASISSTKPNIVTTKQINLIKRKKNNFIFVNKFLREWSSGMGARWLSGTALHSILRGPWVEPTGRRVVFLVQRHFQPYIRSKRKN